jgi:nucleoid DNA-binding protein
MEALMAKKKITATAKKTTKKLTKVVKKPAKAVKPAKASKPAAPVRKITAVKTPMTKSAIMEEIVINTGLTKKQVNSVFEELAILIERHIKKRSAGKFTLPGLMKIEVKKKPATKARKGFNPFTKEEIMLKAKPARRVVKIQPLKKVKDMIG